MLVAPHLQTNSSYDLLTELEKLSVPPLRPVAIHVSFYIVLELCQVLLLLDRL